MEDSRLVNFAIDMGEVMLSSGAETARVEGTIELISIIRELHCRCICNSNGDFSRDIARKRL